MVSGKQFAKDVFYAKPALVPVQGTRSDPVTSEDEVCLPAVGANLRRLRTKRAHRVGMEKCCWRNNSGGWLLQT
jgi:hypothetical protein